MKVNISIVGFLEHALPGGTGVIEAESMTVSGILDILENRLGEAASGKLRNGKRLREELSLLVNGRNVLSLPDKFQTQLKDDDEVVITVRVSGG